MNFEKDGFLSADISEWIKLNRAANSRWIDLAYGLNRIAQHHLLSITVDGADLQSFLVALLYGRGVTNFQGAMVLAERGLILGARILTRSCFEDVFYLGAVRTSEDYHNKFVLADHIQRKKIARALLNIPADRSGLEPADTAKLNQFVADLPEGFKGNTDNIARVAADANLSPVYDTFYRGLSNDAAHPSLEALRRHFDDASDKFLWGPEPDQMTDTIMAACTALIYLLTLVQEHFEMDVPPEFATLWDQYREYITLMGQTLPRR